MTSPSPPLVPANLRASLSVFCVIILRCRLTAGLRYGGHLFIPLCFLESHGKQADMATGAGLLADLYLHENLIYEIHKTGKKIKFPFSTQVGNTERYFPILEEGGILK